MNFSVVAANDTIETKIKRFGFIELEEIGHQLDKAGFHLLPLRRQTDYFGRCVRHWRSCCYRKNPAPIFLRWVARGIMPLLWLKN